MSDEKIRVTVLCVFLHEERILVKEILRDDGTFFYRPLGGGLEFGEHSTDAITREMKEEISADINHLEFLGTLENRWIDNVGKRHHVIFMVYDAKFVDPKFYHMDRVPVDENGEECYAVWKPIPFFLANRAIVYPDGLLGLLMR